MSIQIKVIYDEEKSEDVFSFQLPPTRKTFLQRHRATTKILCDLKRKISEKKSIAIAEQKLTFSNTSSFDDILSNSVYPTVYCSKRKRYPNNTITINSWNKESHSISVDKNDNVIDLKFLLSSAIGTKPEFINFVLNKTQRIFSNSTSLIQSGLLSNKNDSAIINYWLEIPCSNTNKPNEFIIRSQPKLLSVTGHMANVGKAFRYFAKQYPHSPHLGTRSWTLSGTRGEYEWMTFSELDVMVSSLATAFIKLLHLPQSTPMGICAMNRSEWVMADYAGHTQGFITVPLYDTLAKNAIQYIVNHASVSVIICNKETVKEVVKAQKICKSLKYIILMDLQSADVQWCTNNTKQSIGYTHTISELIKFGQECPGGFIADNYSDTNDLSTICYTSGTTGDPKGVLLTHNALMVAVAALADKLEEFMDEDGAHISYLPLAHMYEKMVELICLVKGLKIGYWQGDVLTLLDDIAAVKPTIFMGVPRVYQKFQDKIMMGVSQSSFIKKALFNRAYNSKVEAIKNNTPPSAIWEKLVFSKIKEKFGGRIKCCVSGSAPLSSSTANFLKICFSDAVAEGYGLTETSAAGTGTDADDKTYGQVGSVSSACEMKLVDVEDMNYLLDDEPLPRGEVWFRGPSLFKGYYKNQVVTEAVLLPSGWFATGDIGQWRLDGKLQIVDRKKNIFKLAQGEYIRPEYIENVYKLSPYVGNIFVHGNSSETYLVGIVYPDMEVFANWCKQNGALNISDQPNEIIKNHKIKQLIRSDMEKIAKREELTGFEKVKRIHLITEDFTIDNGILTSTMKLKRNVARDRFKDAITEMYKQVAKSKL